MTATGISTRAPAAPDLTQGPIAPTLIRLALPSIFAMFVQAAMVVTVAYFLGQLGRDVLAGAALVFPMLMLMSMLFSGIFSVWLFNILGSVVRGTGRIGVSAAAIFLVTAVQVPLAGLLILGAGPFPALVIEWATVAAYGIGALWLLVDLWRGRGPLRLQWRGGLSARLFAETLRTDALGAMNPILTLAIVTIANAFIGRMGTSALAGYGVGARLEFLMVPVIFDIPILHL